MPISTRAVAEPNFHVQASRGGCPSRGLAAALCLLATVALPARAQEVNPLEATQEAMPPGAAQKVMPRGAAQGDAVGLYPIALPAGQEGLQARLASELHDGAAVLPGVRAFDLIAKSACLPDEGSCLAAAARHAQLNAMVSAEVSSTPSGYRFHVRAFAASGGALLGEEQGEVIGGPLDLAASLEHGVCTSLGAAPCAGKLWVGLVPGDGLNARLLVDGHDQGPLPLAGSLSLPVGRHLVQAGTAERRVRISYGREVRLACATRAGQPALLDEAELAADAVPAEALSLGLSPRAVEPVRAMVARVLLGSGAALLATSAGLELYSRTSAAQMGGRGGASTLASSDAEASRASAVHTASTAALLLAATGIGSIAAGGILVAATPGGLAAVGHF